MKKVNGQWGAFLVDASGSSQFAPSTIKGVNFREFWHVGKFGALGWGVSNATQRLYWIFPDDDQDGLSDILEQEIVEADPFDSILSIADVIGSDDFDGDELTNAQEWAAKTDPTRKDTDGDRIPDGDDPLPLTWRDTDGDGLPDDWETFYDLNPQYTNGIHGASGDPDGDGFTNIEEYRLGSNPTSPVGLGYVFHRGKIGQLQVTIQDSTNCAGNNASRQFVQRTIQFVEMTNSNMRPMEFTFKVSVTGRVERQNSGYDLVKVNDELVFGGSNEGLECQMANKSGDVLVKVQVPPGEITLSYDTGDSLYHVSAFASVTDIVMVDVNTNILKVESVSAVGATKVTTVVGDANISHFVTPKGGAGDTVTLTATITPDTPETRAQIDWDGATEDANNPLKATVPKDTAAKHEVKIKLAGSGCVCKETRVWVVWSTIATTDRPIQYQEPVDVGGFKLGAFISGGYNFTHTIIPATIITDANRPDLTGANITAPPGGNHWTGDPLSGGANHKWDNSRQLRTKKLNPAGIADTNFTQPPPPSDISYPTDSVEGNDDRGTGDETNDPYSSGGVLTGTDAPGVGIAHAAASNGDTFEWRLHFREFTRLEIEGTWHRISDDYLWRIHLKFKKVTGKWTNDGSNKALDNSGF